MKISRVAEARPVAQSPSGSLVVSIKDDKLQINNLGPSQSRNSNVATGINLKTLTSVRFSSDDSLLALLSPTRVEVISREKRTQRMKLNNGSGTLGSFYSADFLSSHRLLTVWEFGRARIWNIITGSFVDLGDFKTGCEGASWAFRPRVNTLTPTLINLAKDGADDILCIRTEIGNLIKSMKLRTVDAQEVSFSPDGRWFAVRDTPVSLECESAHFYTPDGNRYSTYPHGTSHRINDLGTKSLTWSPASDLVALSTFYGDLVLLDTKTFVPKAKLEHTAVVTLDGATRHGVNEVPIWQESASASNERSYERKRQPASMIMTQPKPSTDPQELGIAETRFNSTGRYLATRDERFQSTIWLWDLHRIYGETRVVHAVLMQHRNVRMMQWHPTQPQSLMFDCGEDIVYHYDVEKLEHPPQIINVAPTLRGTATYTWVTSTSSGLVIRATTKRKHCLVYPDREAEESDDEMVEARPVRMGMLTEREYEAGEVVQGRNETSELAERREDQSDSEDSVHEMLTGRKPFPAKGEEELESGFMDLEDDNSAANLEDTFREKKRKPSVDEIEVDPFDDSQIF